MVVNFWGGVGKASYFWNTMLRKGKNMFGDQLTEMLTYANAAASIVTTRKGAFVRIFMCNRQLLNVSRRLGGLFDVLTL